MCLHLFESSRRLSLLSLALLPRFIALPISILFFVIFLERCLTTFTSSSIFVLQSILYPCYATTLPSLFSSHVPSFSSSPSTLELELRPTPNPAPQERAHDYVSLP
jgi:hypothetical protein